MPIKIVRLGSPRQEGEGLRIGTVRRPPRGVPKEDFAKLDYYDIWYPNLSPTPETIKIASGNFNTMAWTQFEKAFRKEMSEPDARRTLDLLAALSHHSSFSVGCYCESESHCHRSILRALLKERGASIEA